MQVKDLADYLPLDGDIVFINGTANSADYICVGATNGFDYIEYVLNSELADKEVLSIRAIDNQLFIGIFDDTIDK